MSEIKSIHAISRRCIECGGTICCWNCCPNSSLQAELAKSRERVKFFEDDTNETITDFAKRNARLFNENQSLAARVKELEKELLSYRTPNFRDHVFKTEQALRCAKEAFQTVDELNKESKKLLDGYCGWCGDQDDDEGRECHRQSCIVLLAQETLKAIKKMEGK